MSNWRMFFKSLRHHPGIPLGLAWPFMVLCAIINRTDAAELRISRIAIIVSVTGLLPWIPILWTAWTGRHEYASQQTKESQP